MIGSMFLLLLAIGLASLGTDWLRRADTIFQDISSLIIFLIAAIFLSAAFIVGELSLLRQKSMAEAKLMRCAIAKLSKKASDDIQDLENIRNE